MQFRNIFITLAAAAALTGCVKFDVSGNQGTGSDTDENYYLNTFACSAMSVYYLWTDEVSDAISSWKVTDNPVEKVLEVRYKDSDGNDIDRWTEMLESYSSTSSSVQGTGTSYGYDVTFYYLDAARTRICAVINYTYADSPAREAGLVRGDAIVKANGKEITSENLSEIYYDDLFGGTSSTLELADGRTVTLTAREFYADPVLVRRTFDCVGGRVGYLAYTNFTMDSCEDLIKACRAFNDEGGIESLILDLRYNTGGYAYAEYVLGSLVAPLSAVNAGSVFETEIYNSTLAEAWGRSEVKFETEYDFTANDKKYKFSSAGANLDIDKLYVLTGPNTASASEGLITGLMPYMDVTLIGKQTHGKFCGGILMSAKEWYESYRSTLQQSGYDVDKAKEYAADWGLYVMVSRYADKNGNTPCMPNGFTPDIDATDNPAEGIALGDESEAMLAVALQEAGGVLPAPAATKKPSRIGGRHIGSPVPDAPAPRSLRVLSFERP